MSGVQLFNGVLRPVEKGVYPMIFIILPFPYQTPKGTTFIRKYGQYNLIFYCPEDCTIPAGRIPRMLMSLIITHYIRNYKDIKDDVKSRTVELGTLATLSRLMGYNSHGGGKRGTGTLIIQSLEELSTVSISTTSRIVQGFYRGIRIQNLHLFEDIQLLWNLSGKHQTDLFNSYVTLSTNFCRMLHHNCVPINIHVYNELSTARLQDLYVWLVRRLKTVKREELVPWNLILPQFYDNVNRNVFSRQKADLLRNLAEVKNHYPEAKLKQSEAGLILFPSRLHIPEADTGYMSP